MGVSHSGIRIKRTERTELGVTQLGHTDDMPGAVGEAARRKSLFIGSQLGGAVSFLFFSAEN